MTSKINVISQRFGVSMTPLSRLKEIMLSCYESALKVKELFLKILHGGGGGGKGGRETGRKGGGRCTGGGRTGGRKRDSQGGGKPEKKGKITQHCAIFRNRKNAKGREPKNTGREPGLKGTGSGRFKPPCPPPPLHGACGQVFPLSSLPLSQEPTA